MRIVIFGANGGTGRLLAEQGLDAGHEIVAVTRNPRDFPLAHDRLTVAKADVHDRPGVVDALEGADAVLSTLGVPFTRKPIEVYGEGIASIVAAMEAHGVKRLVAVSSAATEPTHHADGGFLMNRVIQPLVLATIGKTTYRDMRRMEEVLRASDLDWTVLRPGGLFDAPAVSEYELAERSSDRIFTSRADLAAGLLEQVTSTEWIQRFVAINTVHGAPTLLQMMRREAVGSH